ncbi:hypothetical protein [Peribacillus simplex]|nr:hypothetical protein [Peribacillus simplex]
MNWGHSILMGKSLSIQSSSKGFISYGEFQTRASFYAFSFSKVSDES